MAPKIPTQTVPRITFKDRFVNMLIRLNSLGFVAKVSLWILIWLMPLAALIYYNPEARYIAFSSALLMIVMLLSAMLPPALHRKEEAKVLKIIEQHATNIANGRILQKRVEEKVQEFMPKPEVIAEPEEQGSSEPNYDSKLAKYYPYTMLNRITKMAQNYDHKKGKYIAEKCKYLYFYDEDNNNALYHYNEGLQSWIHKGQRYNPPVQK